MIRNLVLLVFMVLAVSACRARTPASEFAIKAAWTHRIEGLTHYSLGSGVNIWVKSQPIVTAADIKRAWYVRDNLNRPAVMIEFDAAGTARMSKFSSDHISMPVAVFVNRDLVSAPLVEGTIGSTFMVMGLGDQPHAEDFIIRCRKVRAAATEKSPEHAGG